MTIKAIRDLLLADEQLVAYLAEYDGSPAIFATDYVPGEAQRPYCVIEPEVTVDRDRLLDGTPYSQDVTHDIKLFAEATGATTGIEAAARRIADLLEGARPTVERWRKARINVVQGPIGLSADTDSYGRLVSVRVHLTR
jgi:hypothetical protein